MVSRRECFDIKALFLLFKRKLRIRLLTYFLIVSFLPVLLVGLIPYYKSQEIVEKQVLELAQSVVNQLNGNINYYLKEMDLMSNMIYYQIMSTESGFNELDVVELDQFLNELKNNRPFIQDIHVVMEKQAISTAPLLDRETLNKQEWYESSVKRIDEKGWIGPHHNSYTKADSEATSVVSLVYPFTYETENVTLLIDMKQETLTELFNNPNLTDDGTLLLIDKFGEVIYSTDESLLVGSAKKYINTTDVFEHLDNQYHLVYDINFFSGWKVTALIPESLINKSFDSVKKIVFILLGVFLIISVALAFTLSDRFISPLRRLQSDIREVEKGDFQIRTKIDSIDEIGDLSSSFNNMVEEIDMLVEEISINEKKKKKIEMQSLQYQINPHFLYNTLNSIQWIAKLHKVPDISEMLTNLIKLLRTSLDSSNHLHTLEEELEVLNFYLKIQEHRYPDQFSIDYVIGPHLFSAYVPRFILQPLVENVFFHAFTDGEGEIIIEAVEENQLMIIRVIDNGRGMTPSVVNNILNREHNREGKISSGIGVHNVDDKIKLYFGQEYGLRITSKEGIGTSISIVLPMTFTRGEGDTVVERLTSGR